MGNYVFKFKVKEISCGNCSAVLTVNDYIIPFEATYMGQEPLASMVNACANLMSRGKTYKIKLEDEPDYFFLEISFELRENNMLRLNIIKEKEIRQSWEEDIPFNLFVSAIISESFRVLNAFGLYGYMSAWMDHTDFPLANLLLICELYDKDISEGYKLDTSISKEVEHIQKSISKFNIAQETRIDECTVYYDAWQMQCCGKPFYVGDIVEWTGFYPSRYKNMKGYIIDFDEEHHDYTTHKIKGTVTNIIADNSKHPKDEKFRRYVSSPEIRVNVQSANGWEDVPEGDDKYDIDLWGYIVELENVIIIPIDRKKELLKEVERRVLLQCKGKKVTPLELRQMILKELDQCQFLKQAAKVEKSFFKKNFERIGKSQQDEKKVNIQNSETKEGKSHVKHVLRIEPEYDAIMYDEEDTAWSSLDDLYDNQGKPIDMPELISWQKEIEPIVVASNTGKPYEKDWINYHTRGLELAYKLREMLSDDFELWYSAPFEDKSGTIPKPILINKKEHMDNVEIARRKHLLCLETTRKLEEQEKNELEEIKLHAFEILRDNPGCEHCNWRDLLIEEYGKDLTDFYGSPDDVYSSLEDLWESPYYDKKSKLEYDFKDWAEAFATDASVQMYYDLIR